MNNVVSQSVPHLHVHVVPRTKGDGLRGFFWPRTRYAEGEREAYAALLRDALSRLTAPGPLRARRGGCSLRRRGGYLEVSPRRSHRAAVRTVPRTVPRAASPPNARRRGRHRERPAHQCPDTAAPSGGTARAPAPRPSSECRPGSPRTRRPAGLSTAAAATGRGRRLRPGPTRWSACCRSTPGDRLPAGRARSRSRSRRADRGRLGERPGVRRGAARRRQRGVRHGAPPARAWPAGRRDAPGALPMPTSTGVVRPLSGRGPRARRAGGSLREERAQHVLHDPAVAVVVRLAGGVDPDAASNSTSSSARDLAPCAACVPSLSAVMPVIVNVSSPVRPSDSRLALGELQRQHAHADQVRAVDALVATRR